MFQQLRQLLLKKQLPKRKKLYLKPILLKGMSLFTNGDYKNAETKFNEVLAKSPDNADAAYFGGVSTYINGNTAKAEQQFDKLVAQRRLCRRLEMV
jgi:Flp pilus assembly protein TadD